jgi:serine/threonine protein kinase
MTSSNEASDLIADLVTKWEDSIEIGLKLTPKEICLEHPELEKIVTEQITKLKRMRWLTATWDSNASETLPNGTVIANRFKIDGVLGSGGFGTVYRAIDNELLRSVALKIANPNRNDPDALLTEARKAASLHHPNVVTVHDVGRFEERVFIVSQLIEGRSLKDVAYGNKLTANQIARWMKQVAEALAVAHQNGLVHRDLKPSNIIINTNQQAMVSDFGIAFHADEVDQIEPLTGTLPYMSPEQVQGEPKLMGPKSDVFSYGVMLYELLAGKHPFLSKSSSETIRKINSAKPEPLTDAPIQLRVLCEQCLAIRPEDRPSAADLVARLDQFLAADNQRSAKFILLLPVALGALLITAVCGLFLWKFLFETPQKDTANLSAPAVRASNDRAVPAPNAQAQTTAEEAIENQAITQAFEEQSDQEKPVTATIPKVIDLMPLIDPPKHTIRGLWKITNGVLSVVSPGGANESVGAALHIDYRPKGAYTLTVRARRSRNGGLVVPFVFSGRQFGGFLSGGWRGSKIPEARPMIEYEEDFFPSTDWHTVTVDVGADRIRCVSDSGATMEWQADYASIEGRPFDMPDPLSLYLKAWGEFEIDTLLIQDREKQSR